jgi:methionyl-tRNA formyltransferase
MLSGIMRRERVCTAMFDTIILLTGPAEEVALSALLRRHNPLLTVRRAGTLAELDALTPWEASRAGFLTPVVVPARILHAFGYGAYNFHPGPPNYPGWVPCHFATYDRVSTFGVTAHVMIERVDAGPIVGVDWFDVPPKTDVLGLQQLAMVRLAQLFWKLAVPLAMQTEPLEELPVRWSGRKTTRRIYASHCEIPPDVSKDELDRRLGVFGAGHFGVMPTITLYGHRFRYEGADATAADLAVADPTEIAPA